MKNKVIKISIIALIAVAILTAGIILLTQFTGVNGLSKNIQKSMQSVKTVTSVVTVTEGETQVYGFDRKIEINGSNALITEAESVLNASFEFARQPETQKTEKIDRNKLFGLNLKGDYLKDANLKNNVFTAKITSENLSKVFGSAVTCDGEANLSIMVENKQLKSVTLSFISADGKAVELLVTYTY